MATAPRLFINVGVILMKFFSPLCRTGFSRHPAAAVASAFLLRRLVPLISELSWKWSSSQFTRSQSCGSEGHEPPARHGTGRDGHTQPRRTAHILVAFPAPLKIRENLRVSDTELPACLISQKHALSILFTRVCIDSVWHFETNALKIWMITVTGSLCHPCHQSAQNSFSVLSKCAQLLVRVDSLQ